MPEENEALFPVGVVWANDLRQSILGTVSFRDFCNSDEVKMASYLSVISVVDHHKTTLKTHSPPMALIGDAQSCNVIVAEQALEIYDRYSTLGLDLTSINSQIKELSNDKDSPIKGRMLQRLLARRMAAESKGSYFIHPKREMSEYFYFLHAILDDTDLLTKVSSRDVKCVAHLLNRMKSLISKKEMEIISLDDLPRDHTFAIAASKRILRNPDMYSFYRKIFDFKEKEMVSHLRACSEGQTSSLFLDTKEQNGCCRVGQTKLFSSNFPDFIRLRDTLIDCWLKNALSVYAGHPEIDLHMHMISTIPSAKEVYEDKIEYHTHQDELWFWIPETSQSQDHLAIFLSGFKNAPEVVNNQLELELRGNKQELLNEIFLRNFLPVERKESRGSREDLPMAILRFRAGSINSRKSMISPYLPRLVP